MELAIRHQLCAGKKQMSGGIHIYRAYHSRHSQCRRISDLQGLPWVRTNSAPCHTQRPKTSSRFSGGLSHSCRQDHSSPRRFFSTTPTRSNAAGTSRGDAPEPLKSSVFPFQRLLVSSSGLLLLLLGYYYITDTRSAIHQYIIPPALRFLYPDAEDAHKATINMLRRLYAINLHPRERTAHQINPSTPSVPPADSLSIQVFGHTLSNPLGVSAGLDKDGIIPSALFALGPAVVEIGGVTPLPQPGNARPRVWRVEAQQALVNRYGLNSAGAAHVARQLRARVKAYARAAGLGVGAEAERIVLDGEAGVPPGSLVSGKLLAVQVARNKATAAAGAEGDVQAATADCVACVRALGRYADIITVNVSSPNTESLRELQRAEPLKKLLTAVVAEARAVQRKVPPAVMVKISPDEDSDAEIRGICDAVWASGVDGVIVANTTKTRPDLKRTVAAPLAHPLTAAEAAVLREQGGYSGPLLFDKTLDLVKKYRRQLDEGLRADGERTPKVIFASGGITTGERALLVLNAGASVAMSYTGLTYGGSGFFTSVKQEMREIIGK